MQDPSQNWNEGTSKRPREQESFFLWFPLDGEPYNTAQDQVADVIKDHLWVNPLKYYLGDLEVWYCFHLQCDCRAVFIAMCSRSRSGKVIVLAFRLRLGSDGSGVLIFSQCPKYMKLAYSCLLEPCRSTGLAHLGPCSSLRLGDPNICPKRVGLLL